MNDNRGPAEKLEASSEAEVLGLTKLWAWAIVENVDWAHSEGMGARDRKTEAEMLSEIATKWPDIKEDYQHLPWGAWAKEAAA